MSKPKGTDFSRIHPAQSSPNGNEQSAPQDQEGRHALFSASSALPEEAANGMVTVSCGACGEVSELSPTEALRLAIPSLHIPFIKPGHGSWMSCPSCRRRTWVSVRIHLP